ncbi:protein neprosin-like [Castanea sativa]|uniref:protein neprosin-like n=1 Tax=Castanea sativa TaxID=21020 RepID=UPI003F64EF65
MEGNTNDRTTIFNVFTYKNDNTHGLRCRVVDHIPMARSSNDVGCKRIYREDHLELKRQHKLLNKLAKKTIRTKYGDTYDCINLYEQPFFNYHSLKNHTHDFPVRSSSNPKGSRDQKSSLLFNPSNFWLNGKGCPDGMVPIKRNTEDDLKRAKLATEIHNLKYKPLTIDRPGTHYAVVRTKYTNVYHGGSAIISIYNPKVEGTQYSSARIKVQNGPDSIEVGWTVNPTLYNDTRTRLYTFTKTGSSSCFNTLCNSIIPTSTDIPLGIAIEPISTTKQQFDMEFMLFWDSSNGNWFLKFGQDETVIGFWPKNVFTALGDGANYVEWGGEVFSPPGVPSPPMGSGYSAKLNEDTRYDAYCRQIKTINETDYVVNAVDTEVFSDIVQYEVLDKGIFGRADVQHMVLFGGLGGYTGT